jgi:hypothetical protein
MNLLREYIRALILEAPNQFRCNSHSLGYIDAQGIFVSLQAAGFDRHDDYVSHHFPEEAGEYWYKHKAVMHAPSGWLKVSNANEISMEDVSNISSAQIKGLVDMWLQCAEFSRWINSPETGYVNLYNFDGNQYDELTIPDLIQKHDTSGRLMDYFYEEIME